MRKNMKSVWGATLVGLAGLVASAVVPGAAQKAEANGKPQPKSASGRTAQVAYSPEH